MSLPDPAAYERALATLVLRHEREQFELEIQHFHEFAAAARAANLPAKVEYWQRRIEHRCQQARHLLGSSVVTQAREHLPRVATTDRL